MTAPTPEKIQRYDIGESGFKREADDGEFVFYTDHLLHLKLAQIEILESLINRFAVRSCACSIQMEAEVAALREEIEG